MLFALLIPISIPVTLVAILMQQFKESWVFVAWLIVVKVKFEVNEKVTVIDLEEIDHTDILLFLFVDLHIAIMSHDALVQATSSQSIGRDQVQKIFICQLADSGLHVAKNVVFPRLVEQELFNTKDCTCLINLVIHSSIVAKDDQLSSGNEKHRLVFGTTADYSLASLEFYGTQSTNHISFIALLQSAQESSH